MIEQYQNAARSCGCELRSTSRRTQRIALGTFALLAVIPKCPLCFAAYGILLAGGTGSFVTGPLAGILAATCVGLLLLVGLRQRRWVLPCAGIVGVASVYVVGRWLGMRRGLWIGIALFAIGLVYEAWALRRIRSR